MTIDDFKTPQEAYDWAAKKAQAYSDMAGRPWEFLGPSESVDHSWFTSGPCGVGWDLLCITIPVRQ